jgi:hypothetical protein
MVTKPSPRPSLSAPLKRSDSINSELESAFLKQPFLEQRLERKHQRTSRKWLRLQASGHTAVVHADKLQIAEQTGIQMLLRQSQLAQGSLDCCDVAIASVPCRRASMR